MNDRLITLFGGIASLLIVIALLLPPGQMTPANHSRPTTTDRGMHGLQGLKTWLDHNHIPNISLRRRYTSLQLDTRLADSGNLIIISIPQTTEPSRAELDALEDWVVQGNFALLLGARNDRPAWSLLSGNGLDSIPAALGFEFTSASVEQPADESETRQEPLSVNIYEASSVLLGEDRQAVSLEPAFTHPLLENVASIATFRSLIHDDPDTTPTGNSGTRQVLPLLQRDDLPGFALWEFRAGAGGGWISAHPDLFGNITLGLADNARLFANLVAAELGEDGHVIFDDMHFGVSDLYDPKNFFSDPRLHNTLLFLGLFWLVYLFGYSNRLAPPTEQQQHPRASDFVEAMAGFFARRLNTSATGRGILDHFYTDIRSIYRVSDTNIPVWDLLRNTATVRERDIQALELLEYKIGNERKINLTRLVRTIDRIKRTLQ
jgi:hypothetical protein